MNVSPEQLQHILEAAIMAAGRPLTIANMQKLFDEGQEPDNQTIKTALQAIQEKFQNHGIELREVASGYQFQAKTEFSHWLSRLWEERAPRYSRAFLETLSLIAYRQPVTRAEIEEIRGVSASSHIIKTLQEREWIRVIGYKDIPGKPALYGTTKTFLDYFNLKSLDELPTLAELKDLASQEAKLQQVELELTNEGAVSEVVEHAEVSSIESADVEMSESDTDAAENIETLSMESTGAEVSNNEFADKEFSEVEMSGSESFSDKTE